MPLRAQRLSRRRPTSLRCAGFGPPVVDLIERMPYPKINTLLDDAFPRGALSYWKSAFLRELSDDVIQIMVERFEACPSPMTSMVLNPFHGAVNRVRHRGHGDAASRVSVQFGDPRPVG